MNFDKNLKIFIQTNPQQELAAKVSMYSFIKFGFNNVELLKLHDVEVLKKNFGKKYYRNGQLVTFDPNDLQSFTFLRFLPPKLIDNDFCLIIDPDVFAISNPASITDYMSLSDFKIFCTEKNLKYRSEVMLINCKNNFKLWDFDKIIEEIFLKKLDYNELINLDFLDKKKIGLLPSSFNTIDQINKDTILLHTSNRITQPWKEGLDVDFTINTSKYVYLKNLIKKMIGLNHNGKFFEKKYRPHPNTDVNSFIQKIFLDAYKNNYFNEEELKYSLRNNYISDIFSKKANLNI
jgi:hypothetical protein